MATLTQDRDAPVTVADELCQATTLRYAAPLVLALNECDEDLRGAAIELFRQLHEDELTEYERDATTALLAEILFPNADDRGLPGLDLAEAEDMARRLKPETGEILDALDRDEQTFADRVQDLMARQGLTQVELAEKVGLGQPAISMMLNRECRPQRKTVAKFAAALGVTTESLWPSAKS